MRYVVSAYPSKVVQRVVRTSAASQQFPVLFLDLSGLSEGTTLNGLSACRIAMVHSSTTGKNSTVCRAMMVAATSSTQLRAFFVGDETDAHSHKDKHLQPPTMLAQGNALARWPTGRVGGTNDFRKMYRASAPRLPKHTPP